MVIIFTKHALQQIKLREIDRTKIIITMNSPDKLTQDRYGNNIAQKKFENYLLRVFYTIKEDIRTIITAYKTSKFEKYIDDSGKSSDIENSKNIPRKSL